MTKLSEVEDSKFYYHVEFKFKNDSFPFLSFIIVKYGIGHGYEENCQNLLEHIFREPQIHVIYLEILI